MSAIEFVVRKQKLVNINSYSLSLQLVRVVYYINDAYRW